MKVRKNVKAFEITDYSRLPVRGGGCFYAWVLQTAKNDLFSRERKRHKISRFRGLGERASKCIKILHFEIAATQNALKYCILKMDAGQNALKYCIF